MPYYNALKLYCFSAGVSYMKYDTVSHFSQSSLEFKKKKIKKGVGLSSLTPPGV